MMITAREREVFEVGAQGRDERRDRRHLLDRAAGGTRHWSASAAPDELELAIVVVLRTQQATTPRQSRNQQTSLVEPSAIEPVNSGSQSP
jgi:hypothetical protein